MSEIGQAVSPGKEYQERRRKSEIGKNWLLVQVT